MRKGLVWLAAFLCASLAVAHITPNVELVHRGEFLKESLPGAARFFEKQLMISGAEGDAIRKATGWSPSEEDTKVYVGRDEKGNLVGTVVFLWLASAHGPVGLGVAFHPDGSVRRVVVTDVGSEPLAWVRPLIESGGMQAFAGLSVDAHADGSRVTPAVTAPMSRYYADVIAQGVSRAQQVERIASERK
jgi:hypothetical protein